jgi:hypothetical protein
MVVPRSGRHSPAGRICRVRCFAGEAQTTTEPSRAARFPSCSTGSARRRPAWRSEARPTWRRERPRPLVRSGGDAFARALSDRSPGSRTPNPTSLQDPALTPLEVGSRGNLIPASKRLPLRPRAARFGRTSSRMTAHPPASISGAAHNAFGLSSSFDRVNVRQVRIAESPNPPGTRESSSEATLTRWNPAQEVADLDQRIVALDGKTLRGAQGRRLAGVHLPAAYCRDASPSRRQTSGSDPAGHGPRSSMTFE